MLHGPALADSTVHIVRQLATALDSAFDPVRQRLDATRKLDLGKLDALAALTLLRSVLRGSESLSATRLGVAGLAASVALMQPVAAKHGLQQADVTRQLRTLSLVSSWQSLVYKLCDCSFLYFSRDMLPEFLKGIVRKDPQHAGRIQLVCSAFTDASRILALAVHFEGKSGEGSSSDGEQPNAFVSSLEEWIEDQVDECIVGPICSEVERRLRLTVHTVHLDHMKASNIREEKASPLLPLLCLAPVRILSRCIDVNAAVTRRLEASFYSFTSLKPEDWMTYAEMRFLAGEKYGLAIGDSYLPMGTLEQGLDVLQIMRNIPIFVARYNYDANSQTFIERKSEKGGKHLNTINMYSISNSIRTHGTGMMNTTVNYTYKFLTKKIFMFSQFLFDGKCLWLATSASFAASCISHLLTPVYLRCPNSQTISDRASPRLRAGIASTKTTKTWDSSESSLLGKLKTLVRTKLVLCPLLMLSLPASVPRFCLSIDFVSPFIGIRTQEP